MRTACRWTPPVRVLGPFPCRTLAYRRDPHRRRDRPSTPYGDVHDSQSESGRRDAEDGHPGGGGTASGVRFLRQLKPQLQCHPPREASLLDRVCTSFDGWYTDSWLTPTARDLRVQRYTQLEANHPQLRHGGELDLAAPNPFLRVFGKMVDGMSLSVPLALAAAVFPPALLVLRPALSATWELSLQRWNDSPSPGRRVFKLRVISLSGPDREASSLVLRYVSCVVNAVVGRATCASRLHSPLPSHGTRSSVRMAAVSVLGASTQLPMVGWLFSLTSMAAIGTAVVQMFMGNGRTWIDWVANTQVILSDDAGGLLPLRSGNKRLPAGDDHQR